MSSKFKKYAMPLFRSFILAALFGLPVGRMLLGLVPDGVAILLASMVTAFIAHTRFLAPFPQSTLGNLVGCEEQADCAKQK